jgi:hypothetical protein
MGRFTRTYISWIWVAVCGLCTSAYAADVREARPTVVFRIVNNGQVAPEVVESARGYVEHIWSFAGIQVEWAEGEATSASSGNGLELTMVFVPESVAQTMNRPKDATGFAISNDGEGVRRAYVFVERVAAQADVVVHKKTELKEKDAKGMILGQVIAHEAGHLMLPHDSHSPRGIMQARMGMDSFDQARRGALLFMPEQTKLIHTAIARR